jgi:hypothetical protein
VLKGDKNIPLAVGNEKIWALIKGAADVQF